jgi:hypothetical protein
MLELHPGFGFIALNCALDKAHPAYSGFDTRAASAATHSTRPFHAVQRIGELPVQHGKRLDISLRMPARQPRHCARALGAQIASCCMANFLRPIEPFHAKPLGSSCCQSSEPVLPVDAQRRAVPLTSRHLRCHQHPARSTVIQPQHRIAIVVQLAAWDDAAQARRSLLVTLRPVTYSTKMKRMRANISDAAAGPVQRGIGTPGRLLLSGLSRAACSAIPADTRRQPCGSPPSLPAAHTAPALRALANSPRRCASDRTATLTC